jgi:uncharacterized membrane-anchored protein YjiN (DUF445 family)
MSLPATKRCATVLLIVVLMLMLASAALEASHPAFTWLHAFTEAAAVGAIADWYAVTALFRRPLGLPIPHTAIVPHNKDRIATRLGEFVEHNFLTPQHVGERVGQADVAHAAANWLRVPANADSCAGSLTDALCAALGRLDEDVPALLEDLVTRELERLDLPDMTATMLDALTRNGRHQLLLDRGLQLTNEWLCANRGLIRAKVSERSRYTAPFIDAYIAERFVDGVLAVIREVEADEDHEVRRAFDDNVRALIARLQSTPVREAGPPALLRAIIDEMHAGGYYTRVWRAIRTRVSLDAVADDSVLRRYCARGLVILADRLLADRLLLDKLNAWFRRGAEMTVIKHRHEASRLILDVVRRWDAREIAQRIESEIGKDLQFIRINGTLVGGLVGLALHGTVALRPALGL